MSVRRSRPGSLLQTPSWQTVLSTSATPSAECSRSRERAAHCSSSRDAHASATPPVPGCRSSESFGSRARNRHETSEIRSENNEDCPQAIHGAPPRRRGRRCSQHTRTLGVRIELAVVRVRCRADTIQSRRQSRVRPHAAVDRLTGWTPRRRCRTESCTSAPSAGECSHSRSKSRSR